MEPEKEKILYELYKTNFVKNYVRKVGWKNVNKDDLEQEIWLELCDIDTKKLQKLYKQGGINKVRSYVSGMIVRMCCSKNSRIYKKYNIATEEFDPVKHYKEYENLY